MSVGSFFARLPATSANLGPGFDAVGLAMSLFLTVRAEPALAFTLAATGRDPDVCGRLEGNLMLSTYTELLREQGRPVPPLTISLHNEIPLGMGCGSSAAALLAGVLLATHFGGLGWRREQVLAEACRREGHPDNVAACLCGGFTVSRMETNGLVTTASMGHSLPWHLVLALPRTQLRTSEARALLPATYARADAVSNLASTALLVAAFASGQGSLLRGAMVDRLHQPYRMAACPLLPRLLPLASHPGILGVALSGAGPAVLLLTPEPPGPDLAATIRSAAGPELRELVSASIAPATSLLSERRG